MKNDYRDRVGRDYIDGDKQPNRFLSYEAKRILIMNDIAMNMPFKKIIEKYVDEWGLSESTVHRFVELVKADMDKGVVQSQIKELNIHRTNEIVQKAIEDEDYDKALKAIDLQNKTAQIYKEKEKDDDKDISLKVSFNF